MLFSNVTASKSIANTLWSYISVLSENPGVVDEYLANERETGHLLGPLAQKETEGVQISPFGVIPKSHQLGKWRLILDLSSPKGGSVNVSLQALLVIYVMGCTVT